MRIATLAALTMLAGCTEGERQRIELRDDAGAPLEVHVDRRTGCQYLSAYQRGITPRLSTDGKPICSALQERKPRHG